MSVATAEWKESGIRELVASRPAGMSLERPFYTDAEVFRLDLERIFKRYWLYAGHISRIPDRGDYFLLGIPGTSLIIIRDQNLQIQALHNVCRHRGSLICEQPEGQVKALICPYHQWAYKLDGSLLAARHMPAEFDKTPYGLHRAQVRVVEGLIFVSLADTPPDFRPVELDIRGHLRPQGLEHAKICHTARYEVQANWKLVVENFRECYHCGPAHPEYCRIVGMAAGVDSPRIAAETDALVTEKETHWKQIGIDTRQITFRRDTWHLAVRFPLRPGCVSESLDGKPVAPLMGGYPERDMGALAVVIYPTFWFEGSSDHAAVWSFIPSAPTSTKVEMNWLVDERAVEGVDYDVDQVTAFWRATGEQDWKICENNQSGVNSDRYQPGPYSPVEADVETFIEWYLDQISSSRDSS